MRILCSTVAAFAILMSASLAHCGAEDGRQASSHLDLDTRTDAPVDVRQIKFARGWGYGLLAGGFVMNIAGAVMVEADPYGKVGLVGFIGIGVGLLHWAVSFIALGTTRPLHLPDEQAHWSPVRPGTVTF